MANTLKPPTREQLAKFLPDKESLRKFEELFSQSATGTDDIVIIIRRLQELLVADAIAGSAADQANSMALAADYMDFAVAAPHADQPRRMAWNEAEGTLELGMPGGVTQQIGLETFVRVTNTTGATLLNGKAVGLSGIGVGGPVGGQYFIANGSVPSIYILGVATQDIAPGAKGLVTVTGGVNGIDTTGAPYGEMWAAGDILFASPATAGALTNIKPVAPDIVVPIGVISFVSATVGRIGVRPSIFLQLYYGAFTNSTNLTQGSANTALAVTFNSTSISAGVSIGSPASRLVVGHSGVYNFTFTLQAKKSSSSVGYIWVWVRKNGVDVAGSALKYAIQGSTAEAVISRTVPLTMAINDYAELMWAVDSTAITLFADSATGFAPAVPSATMSVTQINQ
jgi:hypothetical protein